MKKIFALILCLMLLCAMPLVTFAEGEEVTEEPTVTEEAEPNWEDVKNTVSDAIVNWIIPHIEEISVIITLVLSCFYQMRKHKLLNKSMGTLNNNAITVAKESSNFMTQALNNIENASGAVTSYEAKIVAVLEAFQKTLEDKNGLEEVNKRLENELLEIKNYLKTSTDANVEFANELAELLGLANIPNYKKEEIGARHLESVKAIIEAEKKAEAAGILPANTEEVKEDVGEEKKD